jgi:hypothetical protein
MNARKNPNPGTCRLNAGQRDGSSKCSHGSGLPSFLSEGDATSLVVTQFPRNTFVKKDGGL